MEERVSNAKHTVEESAMNGWVRGGADTRYNEDDIAKGRTSENV